MKVRYAVLAGFAALALAGCSGGQTVAPSTTVAPTTTADTSWAPIGMVHVGDLAWQWTPKGQYQCASYQDGCFGVTVATRDGCPHGIYVEVAVVEGGVTVDKANEVTAGLGPGDVAKVTLSPPTGVTKGQQAKVSNLNCL